MLLLLLLLLLPLQLLPLQLGGAPMLRHPLLQLLRYEYQKAAPLITVPEALVCQEHRETDRIR